MSAEYSKHLDLTLVLPLYNEGLLLEKNLPFILMPYHWAASLSKYF
jgi:hypothetical protein